MTIWIAYRHPFGFFNPMYGMYNNTTGEVVLLYVARGDNMGSLSVCLTSMISHFKVIADSLKIVVSHLILPSIANHKLLEFAICGRLLPT